MITSVFALHEKKNFHLFHKFLKICEKDRKNHIFVSFRMFPFQGIIILPELFFKPKCKKAANAYSCVNMKFLYTVAGRKDEIFCCIVTKTSDFSLVFRSTFR